MADIKYYDVILKPVITEKSMSGMFEEEEMENDLKKVDEIIKDYYGLKESK